MSIDRVSFSCIIALLMASPAVADALDMAVKHMEKAGGICARPTTFSVACFSTVDESMALFVMNPTGKGEPGTLCATPLREKKLPGYTVSLAKIDEAGKDRLLTCAYSKD